jgi:hypothetical protein
MEEMRVKTLWTTTALNIYCTHILSFSAYLLQLAGEKIAP